MSIDKILSQILGKYSQDFPTETFLNKSFYAEWLAQTYFFVRHSTSLLGYAMPHLKNEELRHHFEHHLAEEKRHDMIALKDISKLGHHISNFREHSSTQAFYQSQYYRISFEGGTSLLGYILFLEGLAVIWGKEVHSRIKSAYPGADLFLKIHAEEDPHHLESALETIKKLSPSEQDSIMRNLIYSNDIYRSMFDEIIRHQQILKVA